MNQSLSVRITAYMLAFAIIIIGLIGLSVKFLLPDYYMNNQLSHIESVKEEIYETYSEANPEGVIPLLESLKQEVGGELYIYEEQTAQSGEGTGAGSSGFGKGKNSIAQNNSEKFITGKLVTDYTYVNKVGLDIFVLGILVDEDYLVYEVSLQSLDDAVGVILQFFWVLLIVMVGIATILSVVLSRNIASPMKALNALAGEMKSKEIKAVMVTHRNDEIGQLNQTLNELYEELLSSIYGLETELKKERNSERLKKRFLAQATHELKTPISVIRGYAEVLYDGMYKSEEDRDRYLKNIYDETEAMSHLIVDVLDYTKMETGNYHLELSELKARSFYHNLTERFRGFIEGNGLSASIDIDVAEDFVQTLDSNRIEQVLRNLIANAVEHGETQVDVQISQLGDKVKLQVSNDGQGIAEDDLPYLFDSFYKKKGKRTGTGLGLAIVKEIVLLHQGNYRAENTSNGVRFIVVI